MPPPPPNFLPVNRRRNLDPYRRLVSRELWNRVRYQASITDDDDDDDGGGGGGGRSSSRWAISLLRALAYEFQPLRVRPLLRRSCAWTRSTAASAMRGRAHSRPSASTPPSSDRTRFVDRLAFLLSNHRSLLPKTASATIALWAYRRLLVYLHDLLGIGPMLVMLTLLLLMYTMGLGDNTGADGGIPSAYSVFNRGMRRILGTIDGEELARQYAGGGWRMDMDVGAGAGAGANDRDYANDDDDDDDDALDRGGERDRRGGETINEGRRRRRLERLRRRAGGIVDGVEGDDIGGAAGLDDDDDDDDDEDGGGDENDARQVGGNWAAPRATAGGGSRKSGKKARRRDLEVRREMQRQRRAAAAMGFDMGGEDFAIDDVRELEARMALLE